MLLTLTPVDAGLRLKAPTQSKTKKTNSEVKMLLFTLYNVQAQCFRGPISAPGINGTVHYALMPVSQSFHHTASPAHSRALPYFVLH